MPERVPVLTQFLAKLLQAVVLRDDYVTIMFTYYD